MKRIFSGFCAAALALGLPAFPASSENTENALRLSAENDRLALYIDDISGNAELMDKKTGAVWRSCPENAADDPVASGAVISELCSSLEIVYGEPDKRTDTKLCSDSGADISVRDIQGGAEITYHFKKAGITVPLRLTLGENYLEASVDTSAIEEKKESRVLTELGIMNSFGAASSEDEGYFVIPDGSGAIINFNNGKTTAKSFSGMVYGRDLTAAPLTRPSDNSQIYFPMYGILNGSSALLAVCTDGDAGARLNASVSGMSKSSYNLCSFDFVLRSKDSYYMSGDSSNALTVFEEGDIKTPEISVRYYPLEDRNAKGMDYMDIAAAYREYLTDEMNVRRSDCTDPELYITLYGGTEKKRSFLGFPITMKTSVTTCEQAERIMETLRAAGASHMTVSFSKWTDEGIKNKIDTKAEASGIIGEDEFAEFLGYAQENDISVYPGVSDTAFRSGACYSEWRDAAVRVSGEYARHYFYNIISGETDEEKRTLSLLSPSEYPKVFSSLAENYSDNGIRNICLESLTGSLYSDFSRRAVSRDTAQDILTDGYKTLTASGCSILADTANAYALPYADRIRNVPLSSGGYDIFDEDIPFYQLVLCGIKPLASEPVNGSTDSEELLLRAAAVGMFPHYNMTGEKADVLRGTELDWLYYAYYDSWTEQAAQDISFVSDVLSGVSGQLITGYKQEGSRIYTQYENGKEIVTDLEKGSVTADGKEYFLSDYRINGG